MDETRLDSIILHRSRRFYNVRSIIVPAISSSSSRPSNPQSKQASKHEQWRMHTFIQPTKYRHAHAHHRLSSFSSFQNSSKKANKQTNKMTIYPSIYTNKKTCSHHILYCITSINDAPFIAYFTPHSSSSSSSSYLWLFPRKFLRYDPPIAPAPPYPTASWWWAA